MCDVPNSHIGENLEEGCVGDISTIGVSWDSEGGAGERYIDGPFLYEPDPTTRRISGCPNYRGQENVYSKIEGNGRLVWKRLIKRAAGCSLAESRRLPLVLCGIVSTILGVCFFSKDFSSFSTSIFFEFGNQLFDWRVQGSFFTESDWYQQQLAVPEFVYEYAPYVYLSSKEQFWPCNMDEHLRHVTPRLNYSLVAFPPPRPTLEDLVELNKYGKDVYLTSNDDPTFPWGWLTGEENKPQERDHSIKNADDDSKWGRSNAKAIILWLDKGIQELDERWAIVGNQGEENTSAELFPRRRGRVIDAFYFYFHSFNLGNEVLHLRFGNHVGDWEHTMLRFVNGSPKVMFFSQHQMGASVEYHAVRKLGKRPITYSASGTHANYPTPGTHKYALPFGILTDFTDDGRLWDPTKNAFVWKYDHIQDVLQPSRDTPGAPTGWFHFNGRWGDKVWPISDPRQYGYFGQYYFVSGPQGPLFKRLNRTGVCQNEDPCRIRFDLKEWENGGKGPDGAEDPKVYGYSEQPQFDYKANLDEKWTGNGALWK